MSMAKKFLVSAGGAPSVFNAVTWTGDSTTSRGITGVGFRPDFVWIKRRDGTDGHVINDSVRGVAKNIFPFGTAAENTTAYLSSFDTDGFTIDTFNTGTNLSGAEYVAWCLKGGGTAVTNTDGAITSSVSDNFSGRFSVVSWTATNSTSNVGHGLGVAPELIITKSRDSVASWMVYTTAIDGSLDYLYLNSDLGKSNAGGSPPTSSVFYVNNTEGAGTNNSNYKYIAYAFASIDGLIDIGSYTGNGATKTVTTGFQPAFVLAKRVSATGNWTIADDVRTSSGSSKFLYPNLANVESATAVTTMTSTGFELSGAGGDYNASGSTYLYMAIKGVD